MTIIQLIILVSTIAFIASERDFSMNCTGLENDPNMCVRAYKTQKCFRIHNETRCETTTVGCTSDCCIGWTINREALCNIPVKNITCPRNVFNMSSEPGNYCEDNTFCQTEEVCCSNRCRKIIYQNHCWYENQFLTVGETATTTNDICVKCTCRNNGHSTYMECDKTICKWGSNETDIPEDYKPPIIHNTPKDGKNLPVYVLSSENIAYLDSYNIYATDYFNDTLNITISKNVFHHCLCPNSTDSVTVRTIPDRYGNYNESKFLVNVIDIFKPVFHNCPQDTRIVQFNETASLVTPNVTDNVGVKQIIEPDIKTENITEITPGVHMIIYKAIDWSGNVAVCSYNLIKLPDPYHPDSHPASDKKVNVILIIGGILTGCVVFTLMLLAIMWLYRQAQDNYSLQEKQKIPQLWKSSSYKERLINGQGTTIYGPNIDGKYKECVL